MSRIRSGTCADPGPGDAHCTDYRGHRYSCYDAGEDVSWNDHTMADDGTGHECAEPGCPGRPAVPDDTDLTEAAIDAMIAASTPVQIVTCTPDRLERRR